jgi:hypothetical protein
MTRYYVLSEYFEADGQFFCHGELSVTIIEAYYCDDAHYCAECELYPCACGQEKVGFGKAGKQTHAIQLRAGLSLRKGKCYTKTSPNGWGFGPLAQVIGLGPGPVDI